MPFLPKHAWILRMLNHSELLYVQIGSCKFFCFKKFIHPDIYFFIFLNMRIKILWALSIGESRWSCRISTSKRRLWSIWFMDIFTRKRRRKREKNYVVHILFCCWSSTWIIMHIGRLTRCWVQMSWHQNEGDVLLFLKFHVILHVYGTLIIRAYDVLLSTATKTNIKYSNNFLRLINWHEHDTGCNFAKLYCKRVSFGFFFLSNLMIYHYYYYY